MPAQQQDSDTAAAAKDPQTRIAIRQIALRLFRENGYDETTVEQIIDAAGVQAETFHGFFPTKVDVVLRDEMDLIVSAAFALQPPELTPIAALRAAFRATFDQLSEKERATFRDATVLTVTVAEVRARMMDEIVRTIEVVASALGRRLGRDPGDFAIRTFAGAVVGAGISAWLAAGDELGSYLAKFDSALELIEGGLPLPG